MKQKKNSLTCLFNIFFITSFMYGMEQTKPKHTEAIQKKLDKNKRELDARLEYFHFHDRERDDIISEGIDRAAHIVLTAKKISAQQKLNNLLGDRYYCDRKEIIRNIIATQKNHVENFDPCSIVYQDDRRNPLLESIVYKDHKFAAELLQAGAKPNKKALDELTKFPSQKMSELFMLFEADTSKTYELAGIKYKKNNFGDIFPLLLDMSQEDLIKKLLKFTSYLSAIKGTPCIINIPHDKAMIFSALQQAHFSLHYANDEKTEWIFKNDSSIPLPYTAITSAQVIIKKEDTILVVEEATRRNLLGFPAGTAELQELPRHTACRELKEEVNLSVLPDNLELFAIISRTSANRFKANSVNHYFVIDQAKVKGEIKIDNKEILRAFYAPLQDIAEQKTIQGLSVSPAVAALAMHLKNDRAKTYSENFLDYRQLSKDENHCDTTDVMCIEFFAK